MENGANYQKIAEAEIKQNTKAGVEAAQILFGGFNPAVEVSKEVWKRKGGRLFRAVLR